MSVHAPHAILSSPPFIQPDDAARFMFFSRAAIEFLYRAGKSPDVLHVHDWQVSCTYPCGMSEW